MFQSNVMEMYVQSCIAVPCIYIVSRCPFLNSHRQTAHLCLVRLSRLSDPMTTLRKEEKTHLSRYATHRDQTRRKTHIRTEESAQRTSPC